MAHPREVGPKLFDGSIGEEELRQYLESRAGGPPPTHRPLPSDNEYGFLYSSFQHHWQNDGPTADGSRQADSLVCETAEWVEQVTSAALTPHLSRLAEPCLEALSFPIGHQRIPVKGKVGWEVSSYRTDEVLLLLGVSTDEQTGAKLLRRAEAIEAELGDDPKTALLQASQRAYPAIILGDEDLPVGPAADDPLSNMALSPEESQVLESARSPEHGFPLFINGRAGSGKSTILQYLFADLLFYYLKRDDSEGLAPPIYLTANGELLQTARKMVERMLGSEAQFVGEGRSLLEKNEGSLDQSFAQFLPYLRSLVPTDVLSSRFRPQDRVSYGRYRRMWDEKYSKDKQAKKEYGPDLSWHMVPHIHKGHERRRLSGRRRLLRPASKTKKRQL